MLSTNSREQLLHIWLLDSGASFHMTPHGDQFSSYLSCDGGIVYMGNDNSCKVVGEGEVKLKMYDGVVHTI